MKTARMLALALVATTGFTASPADAFLDPYLRVGFGGNGVKMDDANAAIHAAVEPARLAGLPVSPSKVGAGYGPSISAGLWLVPGFRVGATYAQQKSRVPHEYYDPPHPGYSGYLYRDNYEFAMRELGFEAAVRIPQLAGFTFGGGGAEAKAELTESFALENVHGLYYETLAASRTIRTYNVFFGFDQTMSKGLAGFLQVGYHWRDAGQLPGVLEIDDNGTVTRLDVDTVPADFSGWSVRVGAGYDLNW